MGRRFYDLELLCRLSLFSPLASVEAWVAQRPDGQRPVVVRIRPDLVSGADPENFADLSAALWADLEEAQDPPSDLRCLSLERWGEAGEPVGLYATPEKLVVLDFARWAAEQGQPAPEGVALALGLAYLGSRFSALDPAGRSAPFSAFYLPRVHDLEAPSFTGLFSLAEEGSLSDAADLVYRLLALEAPHYSRLKAPELLAKAPGLSRSIAQSLERAFHSELRDGQASRDALTALWEDRATPEQVPEFIRRVAPPFPRWGS
jgi:hypothetical protein